MPRIKSSIKDVRKSKARRVVNSAAMSRLKTAMRSGRGRTSENSAEVLKNVYQVIDKAVQSGLIHGKTGSRYKSRITKVKPAAAK